MKARLRAAWESRSPLERTIIAMLAVVVVVALYAWLLQSAGAGRARLHATIGTLRVQAARLEAQALEYGRLRAAPAAAASPIDLRTLLQSRVAEAGLAPALIAIQAADANQATVVFGALAFADWLTWVAALQAQQVRIDHCRIEALSTPGLVGVSATFTRAQP